MKSNQKCKRLKVEGIGFIIDHDIYALTQWLNAMLFKMKKMRTKLKQNIIISCMVYMIGNDMFFTRQCRVDYRDRPTFD